MIQTAMNGIDSTLTVNHKCAISFSPTQCHTLSTTWSVCANMSGTGSCDVL